MMRTVVIPSSSGSDSTIIMRLHVRPIYNDTIPYSICDNQQYTFEDSTYYGTDAGLHPHLLHRDRHHRREPTSLHIPRCHLRRQHQPFQCNVLQ